MAYKKEVYALLNDAAKALQFDLFSEAWEKRASELKGKQSGGSRLNIVQFIRDMDAQDEYMYMALIILSLLLLMSNRAGALRLIPEWLRGRGNVALAELFEHRYEIFFVIVGSFFGSLGVYYRVANARQLVFTLFAIIGMYIAIIRNQEIAIIRFVNPHLRQPDQIDIMEQFEHPAEIAVQAVPMPPAVADQLPIAMQNEQQQVLNLPFGTVCAISYEDIYEGEEIVQLTGPLERENHRVYKLKEWISWMNASREENIPLRNPTTNATIRPENCVRYIAHIMPQDQQGGKRRTRRNRKQKTRKMRR